MSRDVGVPMGMSDNAAPHLDGCPLDSPCHVTEAVHRVESVGGAHPHDRCAICTWWCICPALRACEARVREEEQAAATLEIAHKTGEHYAYGRADALTQMLDAGNVMGQEFYAKGYAAGLDAATEAVAAELAAYRADCINDNKIISLVAVDTFRHTMRTIDALRASA